MKRVLAIILEIIPILSAILFALMIKLPFEFAAARWITLITMLLALGGFLFFFIGRKIWRGDRIVRILGLLDWLATASVIAVYVFAIFSFGM